MISYIVPLGLAWSHKYKSMSGGSISLSIELACGELGTGEEMYAHEECM